MILIGTPSGGPIKVGMVSAIPRVTDVNSLVIMIEGPGQHCIGHSSFGITVLALPGSLRVNWQGEGGFG
jgi:hypothetical protein